jgi:hypothetical protein
MLCLWVTFGKRDKQINGMIKKIRGRGIAIEIVDEEG